LGKLQSPIREGQQAIAALIEAPTIKEKQPASLEYDITDFWGHLKVVISLQYQYF
jgi:hypothetical protein